MKDATTSTGGGDITEYQDVMMLLSSIVERFL
jgi:hypothetical protein